jgi:hypothetical protein
MTGDLKLFVVGNGIYSGNPAEWHDGYSLILAESAEQAMALRGDLGGDAFEVACTEPSELASVPTLPFVS